MSFNNYQSTSNTGGGGGFDGFQDFPKLAQIVANNVQKISNNVSQLQRMVNQLGTPQDSENLRSQLHQIQHYTNQVARDTNKSLKELANIPASGIASEQKQRRMQKERLTNDFSEALKNFQVIQRTAAQKEKESVIRARANSHINDSNKSALIDLQSPQSFQAPSQPPSQQQQLHIEEDVDIQLLQEREQAIRKIESDIVEVNQIFKDLATLVHDQGEIIDSIEANIESTNIQIHEGNEQLVKASDYSRRARKKKIIMILIFLIILAIIITVISVSK
ncbi:syntaxin-12-like [Dermatophagoides pteronyssinus]|uniref:Syntaxin-12-like n=1 Tax=Dermatophagoides pteronyssinus TaxID=6956 RepID=A0A6P6Y0F2_DERPT|nr:syntaxin-12-like [Dermatophagoides pteronyssinus]